MMLELISQFKWNFPFCRVQNYCKLIPKQFGNNLVNCFDFEIETITLDEITYYEFCAKRGITYIWNLTSHWHVQKISSTPFRYFSSISQSFEFLSSLAQLLTDMVVLSRHQTDGQIFCKSGDLVHINHSRMLTWWNTTAKFKDQYHCKQQ